MLLEWADGPSHETNGKKKMISRVALMLVAAVTIVGFTRTATADTNLVISNATGAKIYVNGGVLPKDGAAWAPLPAVVSFPSGGKYTIVDTHKMGCQGNSRGWVIQAQGPRPKGLCVPLGFMEIGCVMTMVWYDRQGYWIDMDKIAVGKCSSQWYSANKSDITTITKQAQNSTQAISNLTGRLK